LRMYLRMHVYLLWNCVCIFFGIVADGREDVILVEKFNLGYIIQKIYNLIDISKNELVSDKYSRTELTSKHLEIIADIICYIQHQSLTIALAVGFPKEEIKRLSLFRVDQQNNI
ncbi:hypothetical protein ACJX0J_025241, partial [Zea mays]